MTWRRCAPIAAALLIAALALPSGGPVALDAAQGVECTWQRHSKRVVKRVRRHGEVRKVVRWKRWWTCMPQATPTPVGPVPTSPAPPTPEPEPEANRLAVKGAEYYFVLSRPSVKAGAVTIELDNRGEDPHNLNLRPEGSEAEPLQIPETNSLQHSVASFELPAGKYRLWCSLPEHEEKGMETTLLVE